MKILKLKGSSDSNYNQGKINVVEKEKKKANSNKMIIIKLIFVTIFFCCCFINFLWLFSDYY